MSSMNQDKTISTSCNSFSNFCIVLVETQHTGNLGATARAMATMGFHDLRLVSPQTNHLAPQAIAMASHAFHVLEKATLFVDLHSSVRDRHLVVGASARSRHLGPKVLSPSTWQDYLLRNYDGSQKVALVFGSERFGLSNEDLLQCHYHLHIDTDPICRALNLSQAVQIICFCVREALMKLPAQSLQTTNTEHIVEHHELHRLFQRLQKLMRQVGFSKIEQPWSTEKRMARWLMRSQPKKNEIALLHGLLADLERHLSQNKQEENDE